MKSRTVRGQTFFQLSCGVFKPPLKHPSRERILSIRKESFTDRCNEIENISFQTVKCAIFFFFFLQNYNIFYFQWLQVSSAFYIVGRRQKGSLDPQKSSNQIQSIQLKLISSETNKELESKSTTTNLMKPTWNLETDETF